MVEENPPTIIKLSETSALTQFKSKLDKDRDRSLQYLIKGSQFFYKASLEVPRFFDILDLDRGDLSVLSLFKGTLLYEKAVDYELYKCPTCSCSLSPTTIKLKIEEETLVLDIPLNNPSFDQLKSIRSSRFFIEERGIFSISDSILKLVLEDLEQGEAVYPILEVFKGQGNFHLPKNAKFVVLKSSAGGLTLRNLENILFCENCPFPIPLKEIEDQTSLQELISEDDLVLLNALFPVGATIGQLKESVICFSQKVLYGAASALLQTRGKIIFLGVLSSLNEDDRVKFFNFLKHSVSRVGSVILVEKDLDLKAPLGAAFRVEDFLEKDVSENDHNLSLSYFVKKKSAVRDETSIASYVGIFKLIRDVYLMHPNAKILGIKPHELIPTYPLKDVLIRGIAWGDLCQLSLNEVLKNFSFIKGLNTRLKDYIDVGLGEIPVLAKVKDLSIEQFILLNLVRDIDQYLEGNSRLVFDGIFYDISNKDINALEMIYSRKLSEGLSKEIIVRDRVVIEKGAR